MICRIVLLILTASLLVNGGRHKRCNRRCQRICAGKFLQDPAYYRHCLHQRMTCNRTCPPTPKWKHFDKPKVRAI